MKARCALRASALVLALFSLGAIARAQGVACPTGTIPYEPLQTQDAHRHKQDTLCIDAITGSVTGTSVWNAGAGAGAPAAATYITADNSGPAPTNYQVLTAGANITLTPNAGAHTMTVASSAGGGSSSGPANSVQVSNGSGGFASSGQIQVNTTNGWLGIEGTASAPLAPLDIEWGALNKTTSTCCLNVSPTYTAMGSATPADAHVMGGIFTLQGSDPAFTDGTAAYGYWTLRDNRTPTGSSLIGHELVTVSRLSFNGGANLTCTSCAAYYATADYGAASNGSSIAGYVIDGGTINGTGTLNTWVGVSAGVPTVSSGGINNITAISAGMAGAYAHGTGSGCGAGVAVGSGVCSGAGNQFAFFSDAAFPSAIGNTLAVGQTTSCSTLFCVNGGVLIGSNGGAQSDVQLTSKNNGSTSITLKMPLGLTGITLKWPGNSGTLVETAGNLDNAAVTGNLGSTVLFAADLFHHFMRVTAYATCSAAVAASTVVFNVSYGDDVQAQTASSPSFSCASSGTFSSWSTSFYTDTSTNVSVSTTTANSPQYKIHFIIEQINPSNNST